MQAVSERATARETVRRRSRKKLKKLLKNLLTNERECDIMCLTSALKRPRESGLKKVEKNLKKF